MDSNALAIVLGTGLLSFLLGSWLRRWWLRRRRARTEAMLHALQDLARQRQDARPPSLNKAKRRRQQRECQRQGAPRD